MNNTAKSKYTCRVSQQRIMQTPKWRYNEQHNNLFTMHTKVFNLIQRNGLILRDGFIRRLVSFRIRPESPNLNFPSRNSPSRINHNSQKWLLKLLIKHLSWNINTRKPASIARMRMIPPNSILQTSGLYNKAFFLWITYTTAQYLIERKRTTKSFLKKTTNNSANTQYYFFLKNKIIRVYWIVFLFGHLLIIQTMSMANF